MQVFDFFVSSPDVYEGDGDHRDDEVEDGGGQHEVHAADALLVEGNAAPCRLSQLLALVHQVVHLDKNTHNDAFRKQTPLPLCRLPKELLR